MRWLSRYSTGMRLFKSWNLCYCGLTNRMCNTRIPKRQRKLRSDHFFVGMVNAVNLFLKIEWLKYEHLLKTKNGLLLWLFPNSWHSCILGITAVLYESIECSTTNTSILQASKFNLVSFKATLAMFRLEQERLSWPYTDRFFFFHSACMNSQISNGSYCILTFSAGKDAGQQCYAQLLWFFNWRMSGRGVQTGPRTGWKCAQCMASFILLMPMLRK